MKGYWYLMTDLEVRRKFALPVQTRTPGPKAPREARPSAMSKARAAWRASGTALPMKYVLRTNGVRKVRGRWVSQ